MGSSTVMYDDASSPVTFKGEDAKNLVNGVSAKVWVHFNMASPLITDSYNVSSLTDNGTGDFTINFANALIDTKYSTAGMANFSANAYIVGEDAVSPIKTTTQHRIICKGTSSNGNIDSSSVSYIAIR